MSEKEALELVKSLTKQSINEIDCYLERNSPRDFTNLLERFFTTELTSLIFWGKDCRGYKYKTNELRAEHSSLIGTSIIFGEFRLQQNDQMPIWKYRELKLSTSPQPPYVIVTARYKIEHISSWTKFFIIPTPQGPRIDDIELKGAGNEDYQLAKPIKSNKAKMKQEYDCTQKKLKNCTLFD